MNFWSLLYKDWSASYFAEPFSFLCVISSVVILSTQKRKYNNLLFYAVFTSLYIIIMKSIDILGLFSSNKSRIIPELVNTIFELVELLTFHYYYSKKINTRFLKIKNTFPKIFVFITVAFFFFALFFNPKTQIILEYSYLINVVELLFLLAYSLKYFILIFKNQDNNPILDPYFWISTGILFYCLASIPFFMLAKTLFYYSFSIFSIFFGVHFMTLGFLFLSITRASLCKKQLLK